MQVMVKPHLQAHLGCLFSPKQQELIFKRLRGEPFTKTEREYFSRVIRKKLEALADDELTELAQSLVEKLKR